jgi:hypothetical protein
MEAENLWVAGLNVMKKRGNSIKNTSNFCASILLKVIIKISALVVWDEMLCAVIGGYRRFERNVSLPS